MNNGLSGKLYYSSSEVSEMLELEPSVLRFWEGEFSQLRPKRNRAGNRMYREKDIKLIQEIKRLTRDEGYTIAGAKKKLQESSHKPVQEVIEKPIPESMTESEYLSWVRSELLDIRARLDSQDT
jgi:DNA-binding transcriptional MerR regulator